MLKTSSASRAPVSPRLPKRTVLGIAWINGEFSAVALNRGQIGRNWASHEAVTDLAGFANALKTAVTQTGFTGTNVTLLLAHAKLTQRFVEMPARRNHQVTRALQRQVDQGKPFEGPAVWAAQTTLPTKNTGGTLLHVLPQDFHDVLVHACERAKLNLVSLVPASEALRVLIHAVPAVDDEIALIAAAIPNATLMVLVHGDGTPLLVRSVGESWSRDPNRVAVDINRTTLYVQQQFNRPVGSVWLQGGDAAEKAQLLAPLFQVPVRPVTTEPDPFVWAKAALQFGSDHKLNLVTREQKQATSRRVVLKLSVVVAALLLLVAFGLAGYVQYFFQQESNQLAQLKADEGEIQQRHGELQGKYEQSLRQEAFLTEVGDNRQAPVHAWFLGYLSDSLPMALLVTNVVVRTASNHWHFAVAGQVQPVLALRGDRSYTGEIVKFTNNLATGPFALALHGSGAPTPAVAVAAAAPSSRTEWAARLRGAANSTGALPLASHFALEGTLQ